MPAGPGKFPVMLVVQEIFGVHEHIKDMCRRYAKMGDFAIAPEMFARQGDVSRMTDIPAILSQAVSKVPDAQVCADLDATLGFARASGHADAKRTGLVGYSRGGRTAWVYARHNGNLNAAVAYDGLLEARRGNYPLMRTYSGTDDFIRLAELYMETINNAWCAIPLFWFNQMDGRGPYDLEESIDLHQQVMRWYGERQVPVELNEPHHWGMRDAPDVIFVTSAYLSAYNAKAFGVHDYIAQMMFNSPPGTSDAMDLAKMAASLEMIATLADANFHIWRQTRTGLLSYPLEPNAARAHLSASIYLQMALKPHIVHIVGHTEAHHAATADDVIDACLMARQAIENALKGEPDMLADPAIQARKDHLIAEAQVTLSAIRSLADDEVQDPFTDPATLGKAVRMGILDAPHLRASKIARGSIQTRIINGGCEAIDTDNQPLPEHKRLAEFL